MFLGSSFCGENKTLSNTSIETSPISSITMKNCIVDELYVTGDVLIDFNWEIPEEWGYNTYLHANFKGDTYAGNVNYSKNIVQKIRIKKRFKGDFTWKTIYEQDVMTEDDFIVDFYDYLEPSGREVEYAYVAVIANVDADTTSTSVYSEFDSYFIVGQHESYPMIIDVENNIQYNRESKVIVSPGNKYPYVVNNGVAKYYSGTLTATFIEIKDNCVFDVKNGWKYRNKIDQFLTDGKAKIIKSFEGDMWMTNIVGSIPRNTDGHYQHVTHQIEWVECGDPLMAGDLYDNGFINSDASRE